MHLWYSMFLVGTKSHTHLGVVDDWADVVNNISTCRYQDAVLGIVSCIILLLLRVSNGFGRVPIRNQDAVHYYRRHLLVTDEGRYSEKYHHFPVSGCCS
jgi:hypothetical protein